MSTKWGYPVKSRVCTSWGHRPFSLACRAWHRYWQRHATWPWQHAMMYPLMVDVQSRVEARWKENITDSYRGGCSGSLLPTQIVNLSTTIRTWHWNEWHNKRGIVPSRSKLKKENYIESFHGKSGPWAQEVNLKILRKFLGCRAILLNDWLSFSWRFTYWELSNDVKIMGVPSLSHCVVPGFLFNFVFKLVFYIFLSSLPPSFSVHSSISPISFILLWLFGYI